MKAVLRSMILGWVATWLAAGGPAHGAGLRVSPAGFFVQNVTPGREYNLQRETGAALTVYNDGDTTHTYSLSVHRPSERGKWETGYLEIPDASWCRFEDGDLTVGPHGEGHARLSLKIPAESRYYNQHWVATLGVAGKPGASGVALAVDVRMQIETATARKTAQPPDGNLGLSPSLVRFASVAPGATTTTQVVLYNNDSRTHTYTVAPLGLDDPARASRYLTAFFDHVLDSGWLAYSQKIVIAGGQSAEMPVSLNLPRGSVPRSGKWEEVLLVRPDEGLPGFLRCQIEVQEEPQGGRQ